MIAWSDGRDVGAFEVFGATHVLGSERSALYFLTGDALHIVVAGHVNTVPIAATDLSTTCGDSVLVKLRARGRHVLIGPDGRVRGELAAPGARLSVIGTRGGPYVLEASRLRIAKWPGQL